MKPKPTRLNVPALIKEHNVFTLQRKNGNWAACVNVKGAYFTCWNAPSKRKATIDVLKYAKIIPE